MKKDCLKARVPQGKAKHAPGVINANYKGEILVMMSTSSIINIKAGEKIAQLLLPPYKQIGHTAPVKQTGGIW